MRTYLRRGLASLSIASIATAFAWPLKQLLFNEWVNNADADFLRFVIACLFAFLIAVGGMLAAVAISISE